MESSLHLWCSMQRRVGIFGLGLFLLQLVLPFEAFAESYCRGPGLAQRTGSETCWARFGDFCIPRVLWLEMLEKREFYARKCGAGNWKARGNPQNLEGEVKQIQLIFVVASLSQEQEKFGSWMRFLWQVEKARERASWIFAPEDVLGIIRRLLLDEQLPGSQLSLYRTLGFVHLFTASGIHLYSLSRFTERIVQTGCGLFRVPVRLGLWISRILTLLVWSIAWLLSGMRLGMVRPWAMILTRQLACWSGMKWRKLSPLILSLVLNASPGRIHYGLAVGGGFLLLEEWREWSQNHCKTPSIFLEHMALAVGSWIFTALLDLATRQPLSLATPILSLCTLPFFSVVVYPLMFVILLADLMHWDFVVTNFVPVLGLGVKNWIHFLGVKTVENPFLWILSKESFWLGAFLAALILALFSFSSSPFFTRMRLGLTVLILLLVARLPLSHAVFHRSQSGASRVEQLDVGQGDSALVIGEHVGLIDVGGHGQLSYDSWLKLFAERGITRLDWIAFTHMDQDHVGASQDLAKLMPIGCAATSREELDTERGMKLQAQLRRLEVSLQDFNTSCVPYPVHGPFHENAFKKAKNGNSNMSAFWIPLSDGRNYFSMGDAEKEQEFIFMKWAQSFHAPPGSIILKVSHHGSRFSTSDRLLRELQPSQAWISCGIGNRYGHPTIHALRLLSEHKIVTKRTDWEGYLKE